MALQTKSQGLTCPNCNGVVPVPEGVRVVICPFCDMRSLVQGERGVPRWQITNKIEREKALEAVQGFFSGMNKARDLKKTAAIRELFLVYLPYWRVHAFVAGWLFGRVKAGKDSTKPIEVEVMEEMLWNDAAADVSEFGVHQVSAAQSDLEPYDSEQLHAEAMVFEPVESRDDALSEAQSHFLYRGRKKKHLQQKFFEKFHFLRQQLSIVYFPLWVARYEYRGRNYQVVVDGTSGRVLYGKAPGNIFYRAIMLIAGMALGNFVIVNGTILGGLLVSGSDDGDAAWLLLLPFIAGIALIVAGYSRFRHGEEVEALQDSAKKAALADRAGSRGMLSGGLQVLGDLSGMDISDLSDLRKLQR
jgi:hypothetical protein